MVEKDILIISRSFYPTNSPRSFRTTELVKEFARNGHDITLLTLKDEKHHVQFEKEYGVTIKDLGPIKLPDISIPSNGFLHWPKRILKRGLLQLFEYPDIELMYRVKNALGKEKGYDLLISIAAPHPMHWGVAWAWDSKGPIADTWVADCGDPYMGLEGDSFNKFFYFKYLEKWFCRKADFITVPFEGAKDAYYEEFHSKIEVIPQGFSFPEIEESNNKREEVSEPITFAYAGNIKSYMHFARPFLQKLNVLEKDFKFVVFTKNKEVFEKELNQPALRQCEINGYVDRSRLLEQLSKVDFLIHFPYQNNTQKSLKLIDYHYLDKPILSFTNDESSLKGFEEFLNGNFSKRMEPANIEEFRIENVTHQFIELVEANR